jgi:predicted lysophospholipase L1 biosynthesis ABC-type transport system permease subunit
MHVTNADNVGLNINRSAVAAISHELRGAVVQLCVLPMVRVRVPVENGKMVNVEVRKADVLLYYP